MLRRNQRLRKEYLYRKSLEGKEKAEYERKRILRRALEGAWGSRSMHATAALGCTCPICSSPIPMVMLCELRRRQPPFLHLPSRVQPCTDSAAADLLLYIHTEGKPIPTELKKDEQKLRKEVELEDDNTAVPRTHIDDEYARAGEADPKVLLTTSRDPSSRLVSFAKV